MTIYLNEKIVTDLKAKLVAGLNTQIDAINAAQTNPLVPLPYPAQILDFIPPTSEMSQMPVVGISDGDFHFEDDTGWGATGVCDLTVVVFFQSSDMLTLAWSLRRYAQAIARCILAEREIATEGWGVVLKGVRPGPTLGRDENPRQWMSTTAVTITVKSEQDT
jgi:hypothetical protein